MRRLLLAALLMTALCALELPAAHAVGGDPRLARVLAPKPGGLLTGKRLHIRVRVAPGTRGFQAWLDRKDITRSFKRQGNQLVAVVRPKLGVNHVYVRVRASRGRHDFDFVRFVRAHRRAALMQLGAVRARARGGHVPLTVLLHGRAVKLRAFLNGKRLRSAGSGRVRRFTLDGDAGLRFGRNTIRFVAVDERGLYDVERRVVRVGRDHPIPAAGRNRRVKVRHAIRLDARRSAAARSFHQLGYSWRIVQRPKGSHAVLRGATSARPTLRPDRAGRYRLRLELSEPGRTRSLDQLTVRAVPALPAIGVPIDTLNGAAGGVLLGDPLDTFFPPTGPGVQLVALDRTDLTKVASHTYAPTLTGMQQLLRAVQSLTSSDVAIIASPAGQNSSIQVADPSAVSILNQALSIIGAGEAIQGNVDNPPPQGFSAVGVPGQFCCEAALNPGLSLFGNDGQVHQNGDLHGLLQLDNTGKYTYVSPDYVPFNTAAPGTTASQAVVTIGNQTYTSDALPAGQSGFFLLLLDSGSLQLVQKDTEAVSGGGISPFAAGNNLFTLTQDIQSAYNDPSKLLVLQSIGQVQRTDDNTGGLNSAWDDFATAQTQIGGNGLYLNALSPGAYTYVGPAPPSTGSNSQFSATSSPDASGGAGAGQLSGMLARNANSQYWPRVAGPLTPATAFLPTVVYQPATPWPLRDTPAQKQAMACIAAALGIPAPIEDDYTNAGYDFGSLSGPLNRLSSTNLPNLPQCSTGFQHSDFNSAQNELATEFNYVATVGQFTSDLQKPLVADAASVEANLVSITQNIQNSVNPPDGQTASNAEDVLNTFFYAGSNIPGAGSLISLEGSYFDLTAQLVDNPDGSNEVTQDVTSDADSLGDVLAGRLQDTYNEMDRIRELLVSDYGKLQTVFQNIGGPWALSGQADQQAQDALTASAQQLVYESLFPLQYSLFRFGDQHVTSAGDYSCFGAPLTVGNFNPFAGEPEGGNTVVTQAGPTTDLWAFGVGDPQYQFLQQNANVRDGAVGPPPQSLWNAMFATPVSDLLGAPPFPSQLRFMLDVYGSPPHTITRDELDECLVDGQLPPG